MPDVYMQAVLAWTSGQIYVCNNDCDESSSGFDMSVIIASNMLQIKLHFCKYHRL